MSIFIDRDTRVVVFGATGNEGGFWTKHMMDLGTKVVAGVTPGKESPRFAPAMTACLPLETSNSPISKSVRSSRSTTLWIPRKPPRKEPDQGQASY